MRFGLRGLVLSALALALGAGCASTPTPAPAPSKVSRDYLVGPPDQLMVTIRPAEPEIVREVVVRPDGMISVDWVGDVRAAGRTVSQIADDIAKGLTPYIRQPQVSVSLINSRSQAITILGHVQRPATFPLQRNTRVSEALGLVAGPTELAAASRIRLVRQDRGKAHVYRVNLDAIERGDLSSDLTLKGGDVIYVPPTVSASIGFAIRGFFFPLQQILGIGGRAARIAVTGGF
jgi:polysaccharide export outer membrane protein